MDDSLRQLVLRSLDALRLRYSPLPGGGIALQLPMRLRRHFRDRDTLRLVFDEDHWQHDREAELVAIGSPFLVGLESILSERCAVSVQVGGEWFEDPRWISEFQEKVTILNGEHRQTREQVRLETAISVLYEISVPGHVERTELVPVGWHETDGILTPQTLAETTSGTWYTPQEASGIGAALDEALLVSARAACRDELFRRLQPLMHADREERVERLANEEVRFRREAEVRRSEAAERPERLREIDEEERERIKRLERAREETWRVNERAIGVWQRARVDVEMLYARMGDAQMVALPLARTRTGRLRSDLCSTCTQTASRYFLAPDQQKTRLLCEECAVLCRGDDCIELVALRLPSECAECALPRYCRAHLAPCSACGALCCPEHGVIASCCGSWLCKDHLPPLARDGRQLCAQHSAPCSVDGVWTPVEELVTCPITHQQLYRGNAFAPSRDGRLLHPDAVVLCRTTRTWVATDRAGRCVVDGSWHRFEQLSQIGDERVCPAHLVEVDVPKGERVRADRVVICSETRAKLARDKAIRDAFAPGEVWLAPDAAIRCALSGKWTARARTARTDCCDRLVASAHIITLPGGQNGCTEHYVRCEGGHLLLRANAAICSVCVQHVCSAHVGRDAYDDKQICCASHIRECRRCGISSAHAQDASECRWCADAHLMTADDPWQDRFQRWVQPKLSWPAWWTLGGVRVSGTEALSVYEVHTTFGERLYRLRGDTVEWKGDPGWWRL